MKAVPKTGPLRGEACRFQPPVIAAKAGQADMTAGALSPP